MNFEPQCKTQEQLHLEMARVCRMCEGTEVSVWKCVKYEGIIFFKRAFDSIAEDYEFAIAIVEGKPVFRGDELYLKSFPMSKKVKVIRADECRMFFSSEISNGFCLNEEFTWLPPKPKTLTIELPYDDVVHWTLLSCTEGKRLNLSEACKKALDKI